VPVGLLGGTFDPPHVGHLALADAAIARFALERLVVVVTGVPPHKETGTDAETRFRLAQAAFSGRDEVELSRHELERAGPSYTVETARWAAEMWGDAIFLVGADEFADFPRWRAPERILEYVTLGVATRPGYERGQLDAVLATLARPERVRLFEIPPVPVSSSEIRRRVAERAPIRGLVPERVEALIDELDLYR
jgi:nicotinate-nucleotide adenylyltransferase